MDLIDVFMKRVDGDADLKRPINALICFSRPRTGLDLCMLASEMIKSKSVASSIVALHLMKEEEAASIENMEKYKADFFEEIIAICERKGITIRTFAKVSDDFVSDIMETEETYDCNLLLIGFGKQVFSPTLWEKYLNLQDGNIRMMQENASHDEVDRKRKKALTDISSLLSRNKQPTGIFVDNDFHDVDRVFIPILDKKDIHIFRFVNRLSFREKTSVIVWDAIGIIDADPRMKKLYQSLHKRTEGRLRLWNIDEKIEYEFIRRQDLIIIGVEGWSKLISSAISWAHSLPSTLIIKDIENKKNDE